VNAVSIFSSIPQAFRISQDRGEGMIIMAEGGGRIIGSRRCSQFTWRNTPAWPFAGKACAAITRRSS
jgi:transcription elongation factor